jgi:apolipoprotein N-acyltransferase
MRGAEISATAMCDVTLLSPPWRLATGLLVLTSIVTLPAYLAALFLLPPVPPIVMIRSFVIGTALPAAIAWAIERAFRGTAEVRDGALRLDRGDLAVEVPCAALVVRPWWLPLPLPGLALRPRPPFGLARRDPAPVLDALATAGVDVAAARRHPTVVWAATRPRRRWRHALAKFAGFGTIPACILVYTHQHIAYGGTWGQWYLESPSAWLATFAQYWGTTVVLLASYAGLWRAAAEAVVWLVAAAARERAGAVRRAAEAACAVAYYAGVPVLLALRYLG